MENDNTLEEEKIEPTVKEPNQKKVFPKKTLIIAATAVAVIVLAIIIFVIPDNSNDQDPIDTISESTLTKILEISELSTVSTTYNAILRVNDSKGSLKYCVAYEGTVKAGIDFSKIQKEVNNEEKTITIVLPAPQINDTSVDMGTLSFIFMDKKAEKEGITGEAYKKAKADLKEKASSEETLLKMAKENAKDAVSALIDPWVKQIDAEYKVTVK